MCKRPDLEKVGSIILMGGEGSRMLTSVPKPFAYIKPGITPVGNICMQLEGAGFEYADIYGVITTALQAGLCKERVKKVPSGNILKYEKGYGYVGNMGNSSHGAADLGNVDYAFIVPGDAYFENTEKFIETVHKMVSVTRKTGQATLAGVPTGDAQAMTGLGVILVDKEDNIDGSYGIKIFREKPPIGVAEELMRQGKTFASSGVYCIPVSEIKKHYSKSYLDKEYKAFIESDSEKTDMGLEVPEFIKKLNFRVVPMEAGWRDLGTMHSLYEIQNIGPRHGNATNCISSPGSDRTNCRRTFFTSDVKGVTIYGVNIADSTLAAIEKQNRLCVGALPYKLDQMAGLVTKLFNGQQLTKNEQRAYELLCGENNNCRVIKTNMTNHAEDDAPCVVSLGMANTTFVLNETPDGVSVIVSAEDRHACHVSDEIIAKAFEILRSKD